MDVALVTGGTGFIGSHLDRVLLERGVKKAVASGRVRRLRDCSRICASGSAIRARRRRHASLMCCRAEDKHRPETIFHIAAMLAPACDDIRKRASGPTGSAPVTCWRPHACFGVRQVVFASSLSVFGGALSTASPSSTTMQERDPTRSTRRRSFFPRTWICATGALHGVDYRGLRLSNVNGPGAKTHGYLEYFSKAIEEGIAGRPYAIYVEPHVQIPILHVSDEARTFVRASRRSTGFNRDCQLHDPRPVACPDSTGLGRSDQGKGAQALNLEFAVNSKISRLIKAVGGLNFNDRYARSEWGWKHEFDLTHIIESFHDKHEDA